MWPMIVVCGLDIARSNRSVWAFLSSLKRLSASRCCSTERPPAPRHVSVNGRTNGLGVVLPVVP
jgi:hypothetical protein